MYRSITIENNELLVQEELIIKDRKIQQAGINMFDFGFQRSTPKQKRFQEDLHHIRDMLSQEVIRRL